MANIKTPERSSEPWAVEAQTFQRKLTQLLKRYDLPSPEVVG